MARTKKRGAPHLNEAGRLIVKKAPAGSKRLTYFARPSFAKGVVPNHLVAHAQRFKEMAPKCASDLKGMPYGPEHPAAVRACIGNGLSAGGKRAKASGRAK
jgi:hypothetical protein